MRIVCEIGSVDRAWHVGFSVKDSDRKLRHSRPIYGKWVTTNGWKRCARSTVAVAAHTERRDTNLKIGHAHARTSR